MVVYVYERWGGGEGGREGERGWMREGEERGGGGGKTEGTYKVCL